MSKPLQTIAVNEFKFNNLLGNIARGQTQLADTLKILQDHGIAYLTLNDTKFAPRDRHVVDFETAVADYTPDTRIQEISYTLNATSNVEVYLKKKGEAISTKLSASTDISSTHFLTDLVKNSKISQTGGGNVVNVANMFDGNATTFAESSAVDKEIVVNISGNNTLKTAANGKKIKITLDTPDQPTASYAININSSETTTTQGQGGEIEVDAPAATVNSIKIKGVGGTKVRVSKIVIDGKPVVSKYVVQDEDYLLDTTNKKLYIPKDVYIPAEGDVLIVRQEWQSAQKEIAACAVMHFNEGNTPFKPENAPNGTVYNDALDTTIRFSVPNNPSNDNAKIFINDSNKPELYAAADPADSGYDAGQSWSVTIRATNGLSSATVPFTLTVDP